MHEVFAGPTDPGDHGAVWYTIREADLGKTTIATEAGVIPVGPVTGQIRETDIGRRLYRTQVPERGRWTWVLEEEAPFNLRLMRERSPRWLT
jgi:hypothetical protein